MAKRHRQTRRPGQEKPREENPSRRPKSFDATFKELAQDCPVDFLSAFDTPPTEPVRVLNVDLSTVTTAADVVLGIGNPLREVIHIDAQAGPDADLHRNVLVYNALLHRREKVPVHSIVILLRPKARHPNLTGSVRYESRPGRGRMDFGYEIIPLWEWPAEALLKSGLGLLPLALLGRLPEGVSELEGLAAVVQQMVKRVQREARRGQGRKLLTAAYLLAGLRVEPDDALTLFQGAFAMHESTTYQAILNEGGVLSQHRTLLRLGRKQFGLAADPATKQAIEAITDLKRLERLAERVLEVSSWEELLKKR